jgi:hypothetical protein
MAMPAVVLKNLARMDDLLLKETKPGVAFAIRSSIRSPGNKIESSTLLSTRPAVTP